jgi:serine/threonine protein phosphatase PrpC
VICAGTKEDGAPGQAVNPAQFPALCVVLASDGIWDNWEYAHVTDHVMNPVNATGGPPGAGPGVERATQVSKSLIKANAVHANRNFGDQADNATGVVLYIHPTQLPL